jgi:hypothetical protein
LLLRSGSAFAPYSSLESVIENSKEGYYLALRQTQKTIRSAEPDWQPWTKGACYGQPQVKKVDEVMRPPRVIGTEAYPGFSQHKRARPAQSPVRAAIHITRYSPLQTTE